MVKVMQSALLSMHVVCRFLLIFSWLLSRFTLCICTITIHLITVLDLDVDAKKFCILGLNLVCAAVWLAG